MDANIFLKANQIIKSCDAAYIGVIDENGYPNVSTVSTIKPDSIFEAYFSTGMGANKTKRLLRDKRASLCYCLNGDNVTLVGEVEILTEQGTKKQYWLDWFINHFPLGETDPDYCIIKFTTKRVSLWIDCESAEFTIDELLTVQSRCGLLCRWCTYRESLGCGGCIETNGNPFHGECPVAKCCQDKSHTHCGECADLPSECSDANCQKANSEGFYPCGDCEKTSCGKLHSYSYKDPNHGDNPPGARVTICREWAARTSSDT